MAESFESMRKISRENFSVQEIPEKMQGIKAYDAIASAGIDWENAGADSFLAPSFQLIGRERLSAYFSKGLVVCSIKEAAQKHAKKLGKVLYSKIKGSNKIESASSAFWEDGVFIFIPEGMHIMEPVEICISIPSSHWLERHALFAGRGSKAKIAFYRGTEFEPGNGPNLEEDKESGMQKAGSLLGIEAFEAFIDENSSIFLGFSSNLKSENSNFSIRRAATSKNADLTWMDAGFGGTFNYSEIFTDLEGEGSRTYNMGIFLGRGNQQFGTFLKNSHLAKNTVSDMLTKGVLDESARSFYEGTVKIIENSTGSNGYQKQDVLLLSSKAGADAKPNLEIDNNEVRCTHGVSIGQLDKEKLFYIKSRGLSEELARETIVKGFFETVIRKIEIPSFREKLESSLGQRLK